MVIAEHERNRLTIEANDRFVRSGIDIKDVYGTREARAGFIIPQIQRMRRCCMTGH